MRCTLQVGFLLGLATSIAKPGNAQQPFDLDTTFRTDIMHQNVNGLVVLDDGDLIISGQIRFPWDDQWTVRAGARLNPDGTRDLSFAPFPFMGGRIQRWTDRVYTINGGGMRRVWFDGSLDPAFDMVFDPLSVPLTIGDFHTYPDGGLLTCGSHLLYDTAHGFTGPHKLVWYLNTGRLDTTAHHRNANGPIYEIEQQPDGKFLCSGFITEYDGQPCEHIFRVHPDGERDTTFQTDLTWGEANAFTTLPNGRILVSGYLKHTGLPDTLQMVRLMPDGTMDPSFNNTLSTPNEDFGEYTFLRHTALPDGRIVLHGNFYQVDGVPRRGIALLDENGNLLIDSFDGNGCGNYFDSFLQVNYHYTHGMVQDPIGNWYIYGSYAGYDDGTTNDPQQRFVSRLHGLNVGVEEVEREKPGSLSVYPNPATTWLAMNVRLNATPHNALVVVRDVMGRTVWQAPVATMEQQLVWDCRAAEPGSYTVELINNGASVAVAKFMAQR